MTIGFDLDGVLANFEAIYAPLITKMTGIEFPRLGDPDWPDEWDWDKSAGVTREQSKIIWHELGTNPSHWLNMPPTEFCGASLERLQDLRQDGHSIHFITSRPGEFAGSVATSWLAKQGFINAHVLVATNATHKAYLAKNLGLQFFIDDKPENCEAVTEIADTYILDQPWNRWWDNGAEAILRVFHPVEAIDHFVEGLTRG